MFSKILLAFDGTPEGGEALIEAIELAQRLDASVCLLSVASLGDGGLVAQSAGGLDLLGIEEDHMHKVLDAGLAQARRAGLRATGTVSPGLRAATQITTFARQIGADLIVLGHRDQGALARLWNGSVGQHIVAHAPCSVLIAVARSARRMPAPAAA